MEKKEVTEPLTFKVSYTVYGCDDCPHRDYDSYQEQSYCAEAWPDDMLGRQIYEDNRDGLTESCPMIAGKKTNDNAKQT